MRGPQHVRPSAILEAVVTTSQIFADGVHAEIGLQRRPVPHRLRHGFPKKRRIVASPGIRQRRLSRCFEGRLEGLNRVLDEPIGKRQLSWRDVPLPEHLTIDTVLLELGQDVSHQGARIDLLAQVDQSNLDVRVARDAFAFEGVSDELDLTVLLDETNQQLPLCRERVAHSLCVQERHDLPVVQNVPGMENMRGALRKRWVHDDVRVDRTHLEFQEIMTDHRDLPARRLQGGVL